MYFRSMILVTGASGLLGSHVVCELISNGYRVRAMYRREAAREKTTQLINYYFSDRATELSVQLEWVKGDILDLIELEEVMTGCDTVIHCAALVSFHRRDFARLFEINRHGTANVVNTALHLGVKRLVHISSTAAIGNETLIHDGVKRESNRWNASEKVSGYSLSKYSAEKEVWRGIEEGLNAVIVNPSIMLGPGDWDESSLKIMRTLSNGLRFYTPGGNAFVDVRDVSLVTRRLMESPVSGERYLVAGHNLLYRDLFELIAARLDVQPPRYKARSLMMSLAWRLAGIQARLLGKRPSLTKESSRSSQRISRYSSDKIREQFPDFAFSSIEDTIAETIRGRM